MSFEEPLEKKELITSKDAIATGDLSKKISVEAEGEMMDLKHNINTMVRSIDEVTTAVAAGNLGKSIDVQAQGEISKLMKTVNSMVEQLRTFAAEGTRLGRGVRTKGRLNVRLKSKS
ncbi:hypothetical protein BGZ47_011776 [Haplosporangium gracile]|nr:hypothetical protein BGZ47_011776 [Haplosporangium gracile]